MISIIVNNKFLIYEKLTQSTLVVLALPSKFKGLPS